jgi:hypothetical protein
MAEVDHSTARPKGSISRALIVAALLPALIVPFLVVAAPHFLDPMFGRSPYVLGLPIGAVTISLSAGWYAVGIVVIGMASSWRVRLLAFLVFIVPATLAYILGPAFTHIVENLTALGTG